MNVMRAVAALTLMISVTGCFVPPPFLLFPGRHHRHDSWGRDGYYRDGYRGGYYRDGDRRDRRYWTPSNRGYYR